MAARRPGTVSILGEADITLNPESEAQGASAVPGTSYLLSPEQILGSLGNHLAFAPDTSVKRPVPKRFIMTRLTGSPSKGSEQRCGAAVWRAHS